MPDHLYGTILRVPPRKSPPSNAMRVSAIRFSTDLWQVLETEAASVGVSVSQYVREAALMRVAAAATVRGEDPFQLLADAGPNAGPAPATRARDHVPPRAVSPEVVTTRAGRGTQQDWIDRAEAAKDAAQAAFDSAHAVIAESRQTRRHGRTSKTTTSQQRD